MGPRSVRLSVSGKLARGLVVCSEAGIPDGATSELRGDFQFAGVNTESRSGEEKLLAFHYH